MAWSPAATNEWTWQAEQTPARWRSASCGVQRPGCSSNEDALFCRRICPLLACSQLVMVMVVVVVLLALLVLAPWATCPHWARDHHYQSTTITTHRRRDPGVHERVSTMTCKNQLDPLDLAFALSSADQRRIRAAGAPSRDICAWLPSFQRLHPVLQRVRGHQANCLHPSSPCSPPSQPDARPASNTRAHSLLVARPLVTFSPGLQPSLSPFSSGRFTLFSASAQLLHLITCCLLGPLATTA